MPMSNDAVLFIESATVTPNWSSKPPIRWGSANREVTWSMTYISFSGAVPIGTIIGTPSLGMD